MITGGLLRDRARRALALVVLLPALALSGCFTADAGLAITNGDRVNGTIHVNVPADSPGPAREWTIPEDFADRVTATSTGEAGGDVTTTYAIEGLTFDELRDLTAEASGEALVIDIERTRANQVSLSGQADLVRAPGSRVTLAVAFPSPVTGTNGTVDDGNVVRWTVDGGASTAFWATAPASATDRNNLLMWAGLAAAVGVLSFLLVLLWARRDHDIYDDFEEFDDYGDGDGADGAEDAEGTDGATAADPAGTPEGAASESTADATADGTADATVDGTGTTADAETVDDADVPADAGTATTGTGTGPAKD